MAYLRHSKLDAMRRRHFGAESRLRLLRKNPAGVGLVLMQTLAKNFFIGRQFATQQGAYITVLTMDKPADFGKEEADELLFVELVRGDGAVDRYRISTETKPSTLEERWVLQLTAAFNDRQTVTEV